MSDATIQESLARARRLPAWSQKLSALNLELKSWFLKLVSATAKTNDAALLDALQLAYDTATEMMASSSTVESSQPLRCAYDDLLRISTCLVFFRLGLRWDTAQAAVNAKFVRDLRRDHEQVEWQVAEFYGRLLAAGSQWMLRLATARSFADQVQGLPAHERATYRLRSDELAKYLSASYGDLLFEKELVGDPESELHRLVDELQYFRTLGQLDCRSATTNGISGLMEPISETSVLVYHLHVAPSGRRDRLGVVAFGPDRMLFACSPRLKNGTGTDAELGGPNAFGELVCLYDDNTVQNALLVDFTRGNAPLESELDPVGIWRWSRCPADVKSPCFSGMGSVSFWGGLDFSSKPQLRVDERARQVLSTRKQNALPLAAYPAVPDCAKAPPGQPRPLVFSHYERWNLMDLCQERGIGLHLHAGQSGRREFLAGDTDSIEVLHVATHGEVFPGIPLCANLCLGVVDGFPSRVHFGDVLSMDWSKASLIFLNCCLSEAGRQIFGDERLSLAWAFLAAGARAVIAHRWPILDTVAYVFAQHFYKLWLVPHSECSVRRAFHESIQWLRQQPTYADLRIWGSFVLLENAWSRA